MGACGAAFGRVTHRQDCLCHKGSVEWRRDESGVVAEDMSVRSQNWLRHGKRLAGAVRELAVGGEAGALAGGSSSKVPRGVGLRRRVSMPRRLIF